MPPRPQARPMPTATIAKHRYLPSRPSRKSRQHQRARPRTARTAATREAGPASASGSLRHGSHTRLLVRTVNRPCGRTCRKTTMITNTITFASDAVVAVLDERVQDAERERGDHGALELAEAADDDDEEGVDDVALPERRAGRPDQGQRDTGDAGQAGADEEGDAVDARVEMPLVSARSRFCTTARIRRPIGLSLERRRPAPPRTRSPAPG